MTEFLRKYCATVFSQKFRQINGLLKNFTVNWFDGKNLRGREFLVYRHCAHCAHCAMKVFFTFLFFFILTNAIRESIFLNKEELIPRNIFSGKINFSFSTPLIDCVTEIYQTILTASFIVSDFWKCFVPLPPLLPL